MFDLHRKETTSGTSSQVRSIAAPQSRGQQPRQEESHGVASERTSRQRAQPDDNPASMRRPVGQPVSHGPKEAGVPSVPRSRQESGTQREVTAQVAGNQEAATDVRSDRR